MNPPYDMYQEYVRSVFRCAFLEHGYHVDENAIHDGRRYALLCREVNQAPSVGVLFKTTSSTGLAATEKPLKKRSGFLVHTIVVPSDRCRVAFDSDMRQLLEASRQGLRFLNDQRSLEPIL